MQATDFKGRNIIFAKDQKDYKPLPAYLDENGAVVTCWKLTLWERIKLLFTGRFYLVIQTFNQPLQPLLPTTENPIQFSAS